MKSTKHTEIIRQEAIEWFLQRQKNSEPTRKESEHFFKWLAQDNEHLRIYQEVSQHWRAIEKFKQHNFPARQEAIRYQRSNVSLFFQYKTVFASLLIICLTSFLIPKDWLGINQMYSTQKGERQLFELLDGSHIELNTDSEVTVSVNFFRRRVNIIRGEVFFDVHHENTRPFEIHALNGIIRDVGTRFDVYIQPSQVNVLVEEGIVEIEAKTTQTLVAGEQISYVPSGEFTVSSKHKMNDVAAWRQGLLIFHNQTLNEVLVEIGRYHATRLYLQNKSLGDLHISGTFHIDQLQSTLNAITKLLPLRIEQINENEIVLKATKS